MRRDLWRMKGRAVASVLLITLGSLMYAGFSTMIPNVRTFFNQFHKDTNFANCEAYVLEAPMNITKELEGVEGVERVQARLEHPARVQTSDLQSVSARLLGLNASRRPSVNDVLITSGDYLSPNHPDEVVLEKGFATNQDLNVGDEVRITLKGQEHVFRVRGLAVSPEYISFSADPTAMIPLPGTFAIVFIPLGRLQTMLNKTDVVSQFSFLYEEGVDEKEVQDGISLVFRKHNITAMILPRERIPAYAYVKEDLDQGDEFTGAIAFLFLLVAFFVVYSAYARLVASQRREIGVLRGLGYPRKRILLSYLYIATLMGFVGSVLGIMLSVPLGLVMSSFYIDMVFGLTLNTYNFDIPSALVGISFGPLTAGLASLIATRGIVRLEAHEAIRGHTVEARVMKRTILERLLEAFRGKRLSYSTRYMCRNLSRRRVRSVLMTSAIAGSFALGALGPIMVDSFLLSVENALKDIERWDLLVEFIEPVNETEREKIAPQYIEYTEPILRVAGTLIYEDESIPSNLVGIPENSRLHHSKFLEGRRSTSISEAVLTAITAKELDVKVGDEVWAVTARGATLFEITGISGEFMEGLYVSFVAAQIATGWNNATGMYVRCESGRIDDVKEELLAHPNVSSVIDKREVSQGLEDLMESAIVPIYLMAFLGILMTILVVSNIVMIGVLERYVEYGQMRAIGYSQKSVMRIVISEALVLSIIGVIAGIPLSLLIAEAYLPIMRDFFPLYETHLVWPPVLGIVIMTVLVAVLATLPAVRYLGKMNLPQVISERQFG
ncbi:MAG: ABC transporter permease [Thermoplasmata archaeon]